MVRVLHITIIPHEFFRKKRIEKSQIFNATIVEFILRSLVLVVSTGCLMVSTGFLIYPQTDRLPVDGINRLMTAALVEAFTIFSLMGAYRSNVRECCLAITCGFIAIAYYYHESLPNMIDDFAILSSKSHRNVTIPTVANQTSDFMNNTALNTTALITRGPLQDTFSMSLSKFIWWNVLVFLFITLITIVVNSHVIRLRAVLEGMDESRRKQD